MATRYCVECGSPVTTAFCPSCGAIQPTGAPTAPAEPPGRGTGRQWTPETDQQWTPGPHQQWSGTPSQQWSAGADQGWTPPADQQWAPLADHQGTAPADQQWMPNPSAGAEPAEEHPWHPFEQPSWNSDGAGPGTPYRPPPLADTTSFMGVSNWQTQPAGPPPASPDQRRNWILGILAAAAVVAVLVAVAVVFFKGTETATPDVVPAPTTSASTSTVSSSSVPASSAPETTPGTDAQTAAPTTVVTTTEVQTTAESVATDPVTSAAPTEAASTAPTAVDPMGGPVQEIACAPGFVVQIASAPDEAGLAARVAELRAANQLPADVRVAHTAQSCPIWTGTSNSVVLYAGPFTDPVQGCGARAAGAPDSFIKGTTPETSTQISYCVCLTSPTLLPSIDQVGQTNVWVGELQRFWVNKISYPDKYRLPELDGSSWGVYTAETASAITQFQGLNGIEQTGRVDARTWQSLQANGCT